MLYETGKKLYENGYHEIGMDHFALETDSLYDAFQNGICTVISWDTVLKHN
jgi:oxygen-independent coproporphyrinogen-3 oxidase